jgi:hypothetical protein
VTVIVTGLGKGCGGGVSGLGRECGDGVSGWKSSHGNWRRGGREGVGCGVRESAEVGGSVIVIGSVVGRAASRRLREREWLQEWVCKGDGNVWRGVEGKGNGYGGKGVGDYVDLLLI